MTVDELKKLGVDTEEGIKRCAGNEAFYMKLVPMALDESKYSDLKKQIGEKDFNAAFETAHALKGVFANLSLTPLCDIICEITELLRAKQDMDYAPLLEKLDKVRGDFTAIL